MENLNLNVSLVTDEEISKLAMLATEATLKQALAPNAESYLNTFADFKFMFIKRREEAKAKMNEKDDSLSGKHIF